MYFLLNMGIFHCYVSLLGGTLPETKIQSAGRLSNPKGSTRMVGSSHPFSGALAFAVSFREGSNKDPQVLQVLWELKKPSCLGVISPIFSGPKTFIFLGRVTFMKMMFNVEMKIQGSNNNNNNNKNI